MLTYFMKSLKNYLLITFITLLSTQYSNCQIYLGISGGAAFIEQNNIEFFKQNYNVKGTTFTHKLTLGYQTSYFGFELGHRSFGSITEKSSNYVLNVEKKGWEISIRGCYGWGNFLFFGKGGMIFMSNRNNYTLTYNKNNVLSHNSISRGAIWGFGSELALSNLIALRLEYESIIQTADINYQALTLGTIFTLKKLN